MAKTKYEMFVDRVLRPHFEALQTDQQRSSFARAVKMSLMIDIDGEEVPDPHDAKAIFKQTNLNIKIQRRYGIILNKPLAMAFLETIGFPGINTYFPRVYNRVAYEQRFKRKPVIVGKNQMVLTWAEWLHLVEFEFDPEFPSFLKPFLR